MEPHRRPKPKVVDASGRGGLADAIESTAVSYALASQSGVEARVARLACPGLRRDFTNREETPCSTNPVT
jgi:hypothetical protein